MIRCRIAVTKPLPRPKQESSPQRRYCSTLSGCIALVVN